MPSITSAAMQGYLYRFDELDSVSRQRALSDEESLELEEVQKRLVRFSSPYGMKKELLRRGIVWRGRRGWE